MRLESKKLLWDMQRAADRIQRFAHDRTWEDFGSDDLLRSGIERQFEIVGEALTQLRKLDELTSARITNRDKIIGFRNVLIHGYAVVQNDATWRAVRDHLPVLLRELAALLAEPESS